MRSRRTARVFPQHEGRLPVVTKCHREVREGSQGSWWNWGVILEEPSGGKPRANERGKWWALKGKSLLQGILLPKIWGRSQRRLGPVTVSLFNNK